jgi:hypothetical protein
MNKRRIALLAGLMTMGMVSFAMTDNAEMLTQEQKPLSIFNINDRVRFDENRLEMNGNLHLNENNRLEVRVRSYSNVSDTFGSETGDGTGKGTTGDSTEMRMRLYTQTSTENLEVRTELKTNTYEGSGNKQYFRVQPTYYLYNANDSFALLRAGFGYTHGTDGSDAYSFTSSSENVYTINNYFSIEGNVYYDYTFGGAGSDDYHNVDIEAYAYANYPLYNAEGIKVEALLEGGMDPYSFGDRHFDDLLGSVSHETGEGHETYVFYAEPSIKATKTLNENNSVYLQAGYYIETTSSNDKTSSDWKGSSDNYNDTGFVRVGFTSAF